MNTSNLTNELVYKIKELTKFKIAYIPDFSEFVKKLVDFSTPINIDACVDSDLY